MEDFLKNRFSEIIKIEEGLSSSIFKGFDNLYQKRVIFKILFPIATKDINLLTLLAHLYHRNLASPLDLIPLPGEYYCIVYPYYPENRLSKGDLKEEHSLFYAIQIRGVIEFLLAKNIGIKEINLKNFSKENDYVYISDIEERIHRNFPFEMEKRDNLERTFSKISRFLKDSFTTDENIFKNLKNDRLHMVSSFIGFDLRRKEDQIIDGFSEEKGLSHTKVLGIFGREGQGKSVFLKNFIVRNRSLSSPIIFLNFSGKENFFDSFLEQLSWLGFEKKENNLSSECVKHVGEFVENLFYKKEYSSILFIFDDLDRADLEIIEFLEKLCNSINESLPAKFIFTSENYFPFLKNLRAFHLNLSFSHFNEFREKIWIGNHELEDFVEIAWKKSGGNLNLFHWIIRDIEFWKGGSRYKEKDNIKKNLLKNYTKEEMDLLSIISCFPKGFDITWIRSFSERKIEDFDKFLKKGIFEQKGTRLFLKEPWNNIVQENLDAEEKKKIHELGANLDRENSYYHLFLAEKYEKGAEELQKFAESLKNRGQIKEAIELLVSFQEYIEKIDNAQKKFDFYYFISQLHLKTGNFENAFGYLIKSSQYVKPSSEEWMELKVKIAECLYGMMRYKRAIDILKESIKFANLYNYPKYVNAFNYHLSRNLWKTGRYEESEEILRNLEMSGDTSYSGISKRDRGYYSFLRGDIATAKELLKSSIEFLESSSSEIAISFKYLACVFMKERNWDESYRYFYKAMRIFERENDLFNLAGLCSDIGKLFLEKEDLLNAEIWFRKAFEIYSKIENPRGVTLSQFNLTEVLLPFGKWKEVREILNKCSEIDLGSGNLLSYAYDINSLGYLEFLTGNFDKAKQLLEKSKEIFHNFNANKELMDTKLKLSELFLEKGELNEVKKIIDEIESMRLSEEFIREFLNYKLLKAKFLMKKREIGNAEKIVSEVMDKAVHYDFKTILGNAMLLKAITLKEKKEEEESFNLFLKANEIFHDLNNSFMVNLSLLEFYKNFTDKIESQKARDALEWLKGCGYFKCSNYEDSIFPSAAERDSIKFLKFLLELGKFEWIKVFSISSKEVSLIEGFPSYDIEDLFASDVSSVTPQIIKSEKWEILQVPVLKSGVLKGFVQCAKKEKIESADIEKILSFVEPIYSIFYKEVKEKDDRGELGPIIVGGNSIRKIMEIVNRIKDFNYPVLIIGESGTGKELIARYIHNLSSRRNGSFVPVNCSALPEHLLESELFGWVKGAFTGANIDRKGLIEEADGGTFFLDEIGDLPLSLQAKLLRVLQEKETRRLGENKIRKVDVRFISATNKDLELEIKEKRFREDLYYRIKGVVIHLPPLRERKEDIPLLTNYFIEKYCNEMGREKVYLSHGALEAMISYPWPGNVRELESEIRNTIMLLEPEKKIIEINDLPPSIASQRMIKLDVGGDYDLSKAKEIFEKNYIEEVLKRNNWNRKRSAEALNITRQGLFKLMKKYGIKENE